MQGGGKLTLAYYHGKKYDEEKEIFFGNTNIFVFPTLNEAFGLVLLEAMEHGIACVSTNEGDIPAIIGEGETGFMVGRRDTAELAEKLEYLMTHSEERARMGENGRKKMKEQFTLERFEERIAEVLSASAERIAKR